MIRIATTADVPEMLAIYTPYVENTTVSFECVPPTLEEFTNRFTTYTRQFPWLVWEEGGVLLGYAYASAPFSRAAYGWCAEPTVYLRPEARGHRPRPLCHAGGHSLPAGLSGALRPGLRGKYALPAVSRKAGLPYRCGIFRYWL